MKTTLQLPFSHLKDGNDAPYQPPEWVLREFLPKLMDLPNDEYLALRQWLAPANWFFSALNAAQNPLLAALFNAMALADKFAYLAQYTPPPGAQKQ